LSYEAEMLGLAVLFYLYDSSLLLFSDEALLTCDKAQRWSAITARPGFLIAGRTLCVLNPFTPHRPAFRLHWDFHQLDSEIQDTAWSARAQELRRLAPTALGAWLALFVLLPLGLFTPLGAYVVIPAVGLLYGATLFGLFRLRRQGTLLALSGRRFMGFAFECLACPPFAVNMMRRIALASRIAEPLPLAAVRLLDAGGWNDLRTQCLARLDDAIERVADHSEAHQLLDAQKRRLNALSGRS
jgi:hypothetical protein